MTGIDLQTELSVVYKGFTNQFSRVDTVLKINFKSHN
jgi:hypothetical protein